MPVIPIISQGKPGDMFVPSESELKYMTVGEVEKLVSEIRVRKTVAENLESFLEYLRYVPVDRLDEYLKLHKSNAHVSAGACLEALDSIISSQSERLRAEGVSLY